MELIISIAALAISAFGAVSSYSAQQKALDKQQELEAERKQNMELDAARRKDEIVRNLVAARSTSLAVSTHQGAELGSGLPGAYGGESGRANVNELGVNQNLEIGRKTFDTQSSLISAYRSAAQGQGLTSLGKAIITNQGTFEKVGSYFTNQPSSQASYVPQPYGANPADAPYYPGFVPGET